MLRKDSRRIKILGVRGFTLLELMIVISILGILMSVTWPKFSAVKDQFKLKTASRACVLDLRYTQLLSMDTKERHGVFFSQTGYTIKDVDSGKTIKSIFYSNGVRYVLSSLSGDVVIFGTDGTPYKSDEITTFSIESKIDFVTGGTNLHVYVILTPKTGEVSASWD